MPHPPASVQARKYGLGLPFATQALRALQNRIPGDATTQFYGLLSSPTQIDAAREVARAKGGDVPDIGRLRAGQFYIGTRMKALPVANVAGHRPPSLGELQKRGSFRKPPCFATCRAHGIQAR